MKQIQMNLIKDNDSIREVFIMTGNEIGFNYWNRQVCPQWIAEDRFYNCEGFCQAVSRSGLHLGQLFHRTVEFWFNSI